MEKNLQIVACILSLVVAAAAWVNGFFSKDSAAISFVAGTCLFYNSCSLLAKLLKD